MRDDRSRLGSSESPAKALILARKAERFLLVAFSSYRLLCFAF